MTQGGIRQGAHQALELDGQTGERTAPCWDPGTHSCSWAPPKAALPRSKRTAGWQGSHTLVLDVPQSCLRT